MKRKSVLFTLFSGAIFGGIFFLIIAFILSQLGNDFLSDRQVKGALTVIFFDTPTILFRYPAETAGYTFSSSVLFVLTFVLYAVLGAFINLIWTKITTLWSRSS